MLKWLFINEKLDFVELFMQGMRSNDIMAFLSLRVRNVWNDAATFGHTNAAQGVDTSVKKIVHEGKVITIDPLAKQKMHNEKMLKQKLDKEIAEPVKRGDKERKMRPDAEGGGKANVGGFSKLNIAALQQHLGINIPGNMSRSKTWVSDYSDLSGISDITPAQKFRLEQEAIARRLLKKNQSDILDDSDVPSTPYMTMEWKASVADAHFKLWMEKKWEQQQHGHTMKTSTMSILTGANKLRKEPRKVNMSQLPIEAQRHWLQRAIVFLKLLRAEGYIVSKCRGTDQLDKHGGVARIHDHNDLVVAIAKTSHAKWLQRKLEDHWVCAAEYDHDNKTSPYIRLFTDLTQVERQYNMDCATKQLLVLLEAGFWIWRPDILESCYFESACSAGSTSTSSHMLNLLSDGQFWRTSIHDGIGDLIGPWYRRDFTTFATLDPFFHLMVWAVLTRRYVLAEFFWKQSPENSIVNALIAANICVSIVKREKNFTPEVRNQYIEFSVKMKAYAIGIMSTCQEVDSTHTNGLLCAQYPSVGWMPLWEIAYNLKDSTFTKQHLYIEVITREWFGKIDNNNSWFKVMFGILFPPYVAFYTEESTNQDDEHGNTAGFFKSLAITLTLKIDHTELIKTAAPTIKWSLSTRSIIISTTTPNAQIYYTIDGSNPLERGLAYVDKQNNIVGLEPTSIRLPKHGIFTIRAIAKPTRTKRKSAYKAPPMAVSEETKKEINCSAKDLILGDIPDFSIGPPSSKAHLARYGLPGRVLFRYHCFYSAPYVTFWSDLLYNVMYVALYSYAAIVRTVTMDKLLAMDGPETVIPVVVFAWTGMLMSDEARQAANGLSDWWSNFWNKWDFSMFANSVVCVILRWRYADRTREMDRLHLARVLYALGALMLSLRMGRLLALSPKLGPKLVMIGRMMQDVMSFMALLMVVLVGYGVAMHAILEPWRTFDAQSVNTIFFKPMFNVIGDTFLEEMQTHTTCLGEDFTQCADNTNYIVVASA